MSSIEPGWVKDPVDPSVQRYWDGEGYLGDPIPAESTPPAGPPPVKAPTPAPAPAAPVPVVPVTLTPPVTARPGPVSGPPTAGSGPGGPWPPGYQLPPGVLQTTPRPHGLRLAGPGSRFAARVIDILAVLVLCVIANAWFAVLSWQAIQPYVNEVMRRYLVGDRSTDNLPVVPEVVGTLVLMMIIVTTAVWFAYEVPSSANSGQTLGKRLMRIKVVRLEADGRLGFGRAMRRWSRLGLPTLLWVCYGIGFILQLLDCLFVAIDRPLYQALHDKAAATVVVQVPRPLTTEKAPGGRHADARRP